MKWRTLFFDPNEAERQLRKLKIAALDGAIEEVSRMTRAVIALFRAHRAGR